MIKKLCWKISMKGQDAKILEKFCSELLVCLRNESCVSKRCAIPLKSEKCLININTSPFVYSNHKDQLFFQNYSRRAVFVEFEASSVAKIVDILNGKSIPSGVEIKIKTDALKQNRI